MRPNKESDRDYHHRHYIIILNYVLSSRRIVGRVTGPVGKPMDMLRLELNSKPCLLPAFALPLK